MAHGEQFYDLEGCLVFAGYGAIVFMWQISLKRKLVKEVKYMSITMNCVTLYDICGN